MNTITLKTGKGVSFWKQLDGFMQGKKYYVTKAHKDGVFSAMLMYYDSGVITSDSGEKLTLEKAKDKIFSLLRCSRNGKLFISDGYLWFNDSGEIAGDSETVYILKRGVPWAAVKL